MQLTVFFQDRSHGVGRSRKPQMDSLFHSSASLHVRNGDGTATFNDRPNSATAFKLTVAKENQYSKISLIRYRVYNDTLYIAIYTP